MNMPYLKNVQEWKRATQEPQINPFYLILAVATMLLVIVLILTGIAGANSYPDKWKISAYCACEKCCGKFADGITASGKKAEYGMIACNFLPFGAKVNIEGLGVFKVQDRGAKSQFGTKNRPIYHLDVYMTSHSQALQFGVKHLKVEVL